MAEFEVGDHTYKNEKLSAMDQLDLMLDLSPLLVSVKDLLMAKSESESPDAHKLEVAARIATAIAAMPRHKTHELIAACLGSCQRQMPNGNGWAKVWNEPAHRPMFVDIGLTEIGGIVMAVLQDNFANFLGGAN